MLFSLKIENIGLHQLLGRKLNIPAETRMLYSIAPDQRDKVWS